MHEFSVCQALLRQLEDLAREHRAAAVLRVTVQLGPLSGIDPALLAEAFAVARLQEPAAVRLCDAELALEPLALRVRCLQCGGETCATPQRLVCGRCGSWRTELVSGAELVLRRVDFLLAPPAPAGAQEDGSCATVAAAL